MFDTIRHSPSPAVILPLPPRNTDDAIHHTHGFILSARMNSLNIITARVSPPPSPSQSRSNSVGSIGAGPGNDDQVAPDQAGEKVHKEGPKRCWTHLGEAMAEEEKTPAATEETALLSEEREPNKRSHWWHSLPRNIASGIVSSIRWVLVTLASPGVYLIACFYENNGRFAPLAPLKRRFVTKTERPGTFEVQNASTGAEDASDPGFKKRSLSPDQPPLERAVSSSTSSSGVSSDSESEKTHDSKGHARSRSLQSRREADTGRRSVRIKLNNDEAMQARKHKRTQSAIAWARSSDLVGDDLSAQLKSPTSPIAALTRYPKTPAPPRPLIPRRQPSYLNFEPPVSQHRKTLILDLDETLIHSMSRGGRMSTGHMVEVRLNTASLGIGGGLGSVGQHPILYWVNKRPYCDEFLRRVYKWFNLVIFTASVQEYADPVIDWLEQERKFFSARYYRQHCTFRQGAYIKDLSTVEPDLSRVMILDNSPLSYLFHEGRLSGAREVLDSTSSLNAFADNAIPIQGWINDPTDIDLMHLIPLLEGLQYVHDVRALLALRGGEDGQYSL